MTVYVFRVLEVAVESRDLKNSKVILIRITENTGKMQTCIIMRCIEIPRKYPELKLVD